MIRTEQSGKLPPRDETPFLKMYSTKCAQGVAARIVGVWSIAQSNARRV